ncbi:fimbrial protein [Scandinavium goeteborgense]|uniref:Minor fimbrial subunit n=1 Tax=Scandinavium goeteborgense TaxID=1851514 RepID=A0A4R6DPX6_SCAGO|nr:fimbrial protein [Scandinavium goeteborgense]TDN47030.1 minor fimbrial subunit [Scandinavium goeteborgense]
MNRVFFIFLVASVFIFMKAASAADGYCSLAGGATTASYDLGNVSISNPGDNIPGTIFPEKTLSSGVQNASITCNCTGGPYRYIWLWGDTSLTNPQSTNGYIYYDIPGNEYLQIGVNISTRSGYVSIPFGPIHNFSDSNQYNCNDAFNLSLGGNNTGGKIQVSIRLKKPMIGQSDINNILVASTYWSMGDTGGANHGPEPTTNIYLNGNITVPQNCVINAGTQVVVDLGSLYATDFKVAGQKPDNYTSKKINIPIECNDMSATANLTMRIEGNASTNIPNAIQSDNKDVGVVVTNEDNVPLIPNNSSSIVPFKLDETYRSNVTLYAYPVGTTGNIPKEGLFTSLAYLRVDFS